MSDDKVSQLTDVLELEKLYLSRTYNLSDGTYGFLFTKTGGSAKSEPSYECHACDIKLTGRQAFLNHVNDSKHVDTVEKKIISRKVSNHVPDLNTKDSATYVLPGEPVPPGMEGIVELPPCEIQDALDDHVEPALIGLEYLVEIVNDIDYDDPTKPKVRVTYLCLLCEKKGTSFNIITHVGSPNHHINYLRRYFPKVFMPIDKFPKAIENKEGVNSIVRRIGMKIEKKYGRMKPRAVSNAQLANHAGKLAVISEINSGPHFGEQPEDVEEWKKFINFKYVLRPEQLALDYPPSPPPPRRKKREVTPPSLYAGKKPTGRLYRRNSPDILIDKEVGAPKRARRDSLSSVSSTTSKDRFPVKDTSPISVASNPRSRSRSPRPNIHKPSRRGSPPRRGRRHSPPSRHGRHSPPRGGTRGIPPRRPRSRDRIRRSRSHERRPGMGRSRSRSRDRASRVSDRDRRLPPRLRSPPGRQLPYPHRERRAEEPPRRPPRASPERSYEDIRRKREKYKLDEFKEELARIEIELLDKLKYHEKNPEKHPLYPEEWKLFWNRRYKELQAEGKDPNAHDFKPEWIDFWDKRMKELHDSELLEKKKELKDRLNITSESLRSRSPSKSSVSDLKNTWHHLTGTEISHRRSRSRSPVPSRRESSRRSTSPRREREISPRRERERDRDISPRREREREISPRRERERDRDRDHEEYIDPHYMPHMLIPPHGLPYPPRYPGPPLIYPGVRPRFMPRMPLPPGYLPPGMPRLPPSGKVYTDAPLNIITVLRTLTVLENQLGSLGPKCVDLLSQALAMEKNKPTSSVLLMHEENCVMFETIKEKLRGQMMTGVIERHMVNATRHAIKSVEALLFHAPKIEKPKEEETRVPVPDGIDKEAIAKQIAAALVAQGRPDVSNEELEVLIDAVIQMAKAQAESTGKEFNTKNILSQLQGEGSQDTEQPKTEKPKPTQSTSSKSKPQSSTSGLDLLQTYEDDRKDDSMEQLSEQDVKDLLRNFKTLSRKEQMGLITYLSELEAKDPVKVKVYRKYLEIDDPETKMLSSSPVKKPSAEPGTSGKEAPSSQFFVTATTGAEPISDEDDDDDDEYSIEDVYKVAAAKVEEKEKLENPSPVAPTPAPVVVPAPAEPDEDKNNVDVATMSASQASNILDWIKNNASESTDLFKTLLSSTSHPPEQSSSISQTSASQTYTSQTSTSQTYTSQTSTSINPAPTLSTANIPDTTQSSAHVEGLDQVSQDSTSNPAPPPPSYSSAPALSTFSSAPPPPPVSETAPVYTQPETIAPQYNLFPGQTIDYGTPGFLGPGTINPMIPMNPMMMAQPLGVQFPMGGPMSGGPMPQSGPMSQGPPQSGFQNNYQSSDQGNFQGNQNFSNGNYQESNQYDDDDYDDNYNDYDEGNDYEGNNYNKGNSSGRGGNSSRGNQSRGGGGNKFQRGKNRGGGGGGRGNRGGRGRGRGNKSGNIGRNVFRS